MAAEPRPVRGDCQVRRQPHVLGRQHRWLGQAPDPGLAIRDQRARPVPGRHQARLRDLGARGVEGRIRIVDIDTGGDRTLTPGIRDGYVWQNPWFSPDGTHLLLHRFLQGTVTSQVAILATDGSGAATVMGPTTENPPADAIYSPDGTTIIATYSNAGVTWTFDADGTNPQKAPFAAIRGQTWQRQGR